MSEDTNKVAEVAKVVADNASTVANAAVASAQTEPGKPLLKSKTFWANVVLGSASYLGYIPAPYAAVAGVGVNVLLRFLTNKPISGIFG